MSRPAAPTGVVETFGHRPFRYDGVDICQRCWTQDGRDRDTVLYPCATAGLLGLPTAGPVDTCDDCAECSDEANWSECCAACHCCPPELLCARCRPADTNPTTTES